MADGTTPPTSSATASGRTGTASRSSTTSKGGTATASRPSASNGTAAASIGVQAALEHIAQLKYTVDQFEQELQTYNDVNVVGRDTILLRSFLDQGVGRMGQISQSLKLNWTPPQQGAFRGR